jgi:hypothetical protein
LTEQIVLNGSPHDAGSAFRPQGAGALAAIQEAVHLLAHHISGFADAAGKEVGGLQLGRADLVDAGAAEVLAGHSLELLPVGCRLRQQIHHPSEGLQLFQRRGISPRHILPLRPEWASCHHPASRMAPLLITGGAGFIGSHTVLLEAGFAIGGVPTVGSNDSGWGKDQSMPVALETWYQFQVSDNISVTPGVFWIAGQNAEKTGQYGQVKVSGSNGDVWGGVIKTDCKF